MVSRRNVIPPSWRSARQRFLPLRRPDRLQRGLDRAEADSVLTRPDTTSLPGIATTGGGTGLLISFVTGDVEPTYVWPCIALAALGMAYDLARRALDQHHHP